MIELNLKAKPFHKLESVLGTELFFKVHEYLEGFDSVSYSCFVSVHYGTFQNHLQDTGWKCDLDLVVPFLLKVFKKGENCIFVTQSYETFQTFNSYIHVVKYLKSKNVEVDCNILYELIVLNSKLNEHGELVFNKVQPPPIGELWGEPVAVEEE